MSEFLKVISPSPEADKVIIMLPDIWGQTDYATTTAQALSQRYQQPCYMLDYFYQLTKKANNFDRQTDQAEAVGLMAKLTGEDFIAIFESALEEIQKAQPQLVELTVLGFCFGGRLAYLSGLSNKVTKIISFYGAGAHTTDFYQGHTPIEALAIARGGDTSLKVLAFYGSEDASIPEPDQAKTALELQNAPIAYTAKQYSAGHAYFQQGRDSYVQAAAEKSWHDLDTFLS
ncbi:MAG: dienelactone hydrolase family protein [bacterium]